MQLIAMTAEEQKNGGSSLVINYSFAKSSFGDVLIASTAMGLCYLAFVMKDEAGALKELKQRFSKATFVLKQDATQKKALRAFQKGEVPADLTLHLKGTDFQLSVWRALLAIRSGKVTAYGDIANKIKKPKAFRAVGTAVGQNPISFLIPCHRVVPSSGGIGNYHWGSSRKQAMIEWERARVDESELPESRR